MSVGPPCQRGQDASQTQLFTVWVLSGYIKTFQKNPQLLYSGTESNYFIVYHSLLKIFFFVLLFGSDFEFSFSFFQLFRLLAYFDSVPIFCFNISIEFVSWIFFSIPCKLAFGEV